MSATRYEFIGGGSSKFYEIAWHTPVHGQATITYGRIGTAGQQITYSVTEARKKEREKIAKGYKLAMAVVGGPSIQVAKMQVVKALNQFGLISKATAASEIIKTLGIVNKAPKPSLIIGPGQIWERMTDYNKGKRFIKIITRTDNDYLFVVSYSDDGRKWSSPINRNGQETMIDDNEINNHYNLTDYK
jgi:predicted DNA-binding WGR domain protein